MQDRATELLPSGPAGEDAGDPAYEHVRGRVQALVSAARDLSDTCADLADALRPLPGHVDAGGPDFGRLRAERTAALLDEAASAARGTLGLLHSAYSALERQLGRPPVHEPAPMPRSGVSTWPDAFVELPRRPFTVEDEAGTAPAVLRAPSAAGAWQGGRRAHGAAVRTGVGAATVDEGPDAGEESLRGFGEPAGGEASRGLDEPSRTVDEPGVDEPDVDEPDVDEPRHAVGEVDGSRPPGVEQSEVEYAVGEAPREAHDLDGDHHAAVEPGGGGAAGVDEPRHGEAESGGGEPRDAYAAADNSEPRGRAQDDGGWRPDADLGAGYPDGVDPAASWDPAEREAVTAAALAGWVAVDPDDEDAGGRPILGHDHDHDHDHNHDHNHDHDHDHDHDHNHNHDREPAPEHAREPDREPDLPWRPGPRDDDRPAQAIAAEHLPSPVLTLPVDPHSGDGPGWHGDTVSPEPRSLSLVPPVPEPDPDRGPAGYPDPAPWRDEASPPMPAPDAEPWATEPRSTWQPVPGLAARPVWAAEVVPGASAAGDGLPVYPLDTVDVPTDHADADLSLGQADPLPPTGPLDDPSAAVIARQVEAARRHLQAALVMANQPAAAPRIGALLTAVERVLTAVTDLARETRGVLESGLGGRTFPGEARFLCSQPWERVELVGRDAYGDDVASPAGLAKLLRSLGYAATSVTSAGGVAGVQVRSERYAVHVALVEPAGGGRQRWSGALEWTDPAGAPRTWAETLGPVELEDEELARRVDELVRRCVGAIH